MMRANKVSVCVGLACAVVHLASRASIGADYSRITLKTVATGLTAPVSLANPAGDSRLFVLQRNGVVKVIQNGVVQATSYLDISAITADYSSNDERGASSLVFDPNFALNGRLYVSYLDKNTERMTVRRFTADPSSSVVNAGSEVVYTTDAGRTNPSMHFGGWLGFRPGEPDNLYVGVGDNKSFNAAAYPNSGLGQFARVNVSGSGAGVPAAGNPFASAPYVWGYGFRNPWRASFDRLNGDFYIGDVGENVYEEISVQRSGAAPGRFFGWPNLEGNGPGPSNIVDTTTQNPVAPAFTYSHLDPNLALFFTPTITSAAVVGGYVYRGTELPELYGSYIFGDFSSGAIAVVGDPSVDRWGNPVFLTGQLNPSRSVFGQFSLASFGEDSNGELYALNINSGSVYRFAAIPEPGTLMAPLGLAVVVLRRRR